MPDGCGDIDRGKSDSALATTWLDLRILATSDLHMQVLSYDYYADKAGGQPGMARISSLIDIRRKEARNCLLFDNGDTFQGTPMGDFLARSPAGTSHPAIEAMNILGYDAAALGNHDFNYGLRYLRALTSKARFPFLAANLHVRNGPGFKPYTILRRNLIDRSGIEHQLSIGVIGLLPPQTAAWDTQLAGQVECLDILETAQRILPRIKAEGADIVIALAHSGIESIASGPGSENAAAALAAVPQIDVVIAGHAHQVFPGPDIAARPGIDPVLGALSGKPAVMPGFGGSHLGRIDLRLCRKEGQGWQVSGFLTRAEAVPQDMPVDRRIMATASAAHHATRRRLGGRVGHSSSAIFSHGALLGADPGLRLINMAQMWYIRQRLSRGRNRDIPVLSAAAPYRAGGRGGPNFYTDIPAGPLRLRNLSDLYCFPNRICALKITGAQLADWLERTASLFRRVSPGQKDVPLIDPDFPAYNFDLISGISWQVDLSRPARFHADGRLADPAAFRVTRLRHRGRTVDPDEAFILATNSFRLSACGLFEDLTRQCELLYEGQAHTTDILRNYVRQRRHVAMQERGNWQFVRMPGTTALFRTGPGVLKHLHALIRHHGRAIEALGRAEDGFLRLRLHL